MNTPANEWREEFYEKFSYIQAIKNEKSGNAYTRITDYIQNLLNQHSAQIVERIRNSVLSWVTEESGGLSNEQLSSLDQAIDIVKE